MHYLIQMLSTYYYHNYNNIYILQFTSCITDGTPCLFAMLDGDELHRLINYSRFKFTYYINKCNRYKQYAHLWIRSPPFQSFRNMQWDVLMDNLAIQMGTMTLKDTTRNNRFDVHESNAVCRPEKHLGRLDVTVAKLVDVLALDLLRYNHINI